MVTYSKREGPGLETRLLWILPYYTLSAMETKFLFWIINLFLIKIFTELNTTSQLQETIQRDLMPTLPVCSHGNILQNHPMVSQPML